MNRRKRSVNYFRIVVTMASRMTLRSSKSDITCEDMLEGAGVSSKVSAYKLY
jgi:hypothetical protein